MLQVYQTILFAIVLSFTTVVHAQTVDISRSSDYSLLEYAEITIEKETHSLRELINRRSFTPYSHPYINRGVSSGTIWISFELTNSSDNTLHRILVVSSPLLEHLALYDRDTIDTPVIKGVHNVDSTHTTLSPYFDITLAPKATKRYWLQVKSLYNPVDFGLFVYNKEHYLAEERKQQFINILLVGMVLALMIYSFMLSFYTRDRSYLYYALYLFALIYQQLTYLGLTQIYFPARFAVVDIDISVFKITILIATAALYSMHFLKTRQIPLLYHGYRAIITLSIVEMIILSIPQFRNLEIVILTGTLFIVYNLFAGHISYRKGNKQARLFILGFSIVFVSYSFIILDALGLTSIMQEFQNLLMITTALEALILSLAFADRYIILQKAKERADEQILADSGRRTEIIQKEVQQKTRELKSMVETRELLIKEIHHRVKNNLQIILSMVRMQNDIIEAHHGTINLTGLENRINAIAKTYDMLIIKENLEEVDLAEYIDSLISDIQSSYPGDRYQIDIKTNIAVTLPLRVSIYIGLILNEMVTNTYKYAFEDHRGDIAISLQKQNNEYRLIYRDNGRGFDNSKKMDSLGLNLIRQLVYHQLKGSMETDSNDHTHYIIRFTL